MYLAGSPGSSVKVSRFSSIEEIRFRTSSPVIFVRSGIGATTKISMDAYILLTLSWKKVGMAKALTNPRSECGLPHLRMGVENS